MISWIKKFFIPHGNNNHRPYILRTETIRNILIIIIFIELSVFLLPTISNLNRSGGMAAVLPAVLSDFTNQERKTQNLNILTENINLKKAAEMKAKDMAENGYFSHVSPDGKTPWYWMEQAGYKYKYAGENLAINFSDSKDVTDAWMKSPAHRANIVKENYTEIGTGIALGMYKGRETLFVAQLYASPLAEKSSEKISPKNLTLKEIKNKENEFTSDVLGAETVSLSETEINNQPNDNVNIASISLEKPNLIQKIFSSPRDSTNKILFLVFGVLMISLLLNIFIKIKHHHPDLITNGLATLVVIIAIFIGNYYLSNQNMVVLDFFEYQNK